VTTPDLLHEVPSATWLPVCIDVPAFNAVADDHPAFQHKGVPRVLYVPSKSWVKSAEIIEPILDKLDSEGVIQRIRTGRVPHEELPGLLAQCDVLVDQFVGVVGALALEGMAAGRLVLTHVESEAYAKVGQQPPVIEISPSTLENTLRNLKPDATLIQQAREFVAAHHDGKQSAAILKNNC
jgi:glycosyltransferase involved in cell wall biosynthesis